MRYATPFLCLFLGTAFLSAAPESEKKPDKPEKPEVVAPAPVVRNAEIVIDGNKIPYSVSTGKLQLKQNDGKSKASIFHVSYVRTDVIEAWDARENLARRGKTVLRIAAALGLSDAQVDEMFVAAEGIEV